MRPVPIPNDAAKELSTEGWQRRVMAAPDGDLTGDGIDKSLAVDCLRHDTRGYLVLLQLEPNEIEDLQRNGGHLWWNCNGPMPVFAFIVPEPAE